jgi:ATP-dependent DNA helicase RecG
LFQLGLGLIRNDTIVTKNVYHFPVSNKVSTLLNALPYQLTKAQVKVYDEIMADLSGPNTMNRLVQGDVGSGKTIISALALLLVAENGYQGVMMAPTEVLASQHFTSFRILFESLGIRLALLTGSMTAKQKKEVYAALELGHIDVLIGTHAVIQEKVIFKDLGLVITDEQHRFGVNQREMLAGKGHYPHVLVMSATPIPRTLALIVYGDMSISTIDELPKGRKPIETHLVTANYRDRIYRFILKHIEAGRQCYVICPMVEEHEELDIEDVQTYTEHLILQMPDHINIVALHGQMKPKDKNKIMIDFSEGSIDVLVSTTVVEVGVNVPNATIMLIENAERFGLAQLHQLRGRVGRGSHASHCVLISDSKADHTKKRLGLLKESQDGFVIADYDLKTRGPGDTFGTKQHGLPEFKIGNVYDDLDLLKATHDLVKIILENDPNLEKIENAGLYNIISDFYKDQVHTISL